MNRVYNFSAGPAILPEEVLKQAADEMVNYKGSGMSVMEMSHRSKEYEAIINGAEATLREIMGIPSNYKVLFLQGGASLQFAMIPMNLMLKNKKADFINTGMWSKKAISEAKKFGTANVVATSEDKNFSYIPNLDNVTFSDDADYVYFTHNNTIFGTKFNHIPKTNGIPLVTDMSSSILSEKINVSDYGVIFAGAQKNIGPAGVTVVIIREDLIKEETVSGTPTMLKYITHSENDSMFNTPPTYSIYVAGLVFEWIKNMGGIEVMERVNQEKATILYDYLDASQMFSATTAKEDRSLMNVPFVATTEELNAKFIKEAKAAGFVNLKGHRSVGGMRASIYNAMPVEGVRELVEFMKKFEQENK